MCFLTVGYSLHRIDPHLRVQGFRRQRVDDRRAKETDGWCFERTFLWRDGVTSGTKQQQQWFMCDGAGIWTRGSSANADLIVLQRARGAKKAQLSRSTGNISGVGSAEAHNTNHLPSSAILSLSEPSLQSYSVQSRSFSILRWWWKKTGSNFPPSQPPNKYAYYFPSTFTLPSFSPTGIFT